MVSSLFTADIPDIASTNPLVEVLCESDSVNLSTSGAVCLSSWLWRPCGLHLTSFLLFKTLIASSISYFCGPNLVIFLSTISIISLKHSISFGLFRYFVYQLFAQAVGNEDGLSKVKDATFFKKTIRPNKKNVLIDGLSFSLDLILLRHLCTTVPVCILR